MNDRCEDIPPPDGHGREKWRKCERKKGHKGAHGAGGYGKWDKHGVKIKPS